MVPDGGSKVKEIVSSVYSHLATLADNTNDARMASVFETPPMQLIENSPCEGTKDEELIMNIANDRPLIGKKFLSEFRQTIVKMGTELQSLVVQLGWTVKEMLHTATGVSQSYVVQIMTFIYSIVALIRKMSNAQATASYLSLYFQDVVDTEAPPARGTPPTGTLPRFWDSIAPPSYEEPTRSDGDLNQLIFTFIKPQQLDRERLDAFILTYRSFTCPKELVDALISCHNIPKGTFTADESTRMRNRIYMILSKWTEVHYLDLNASVRPLLSLYLLILL